MDQGQNLLLPAQIITCMFTWLKNFEKKNRNDINNIDMDIEVAKSSTL